MMTMHKKPAIYEIIVVEGFHDRQAVENAVEADVWVIGGDRIARRFLEELKRASVHRGIIILTDPDGPGERIRKRIADIIPGAKHAFIDRAKAKSTNAVGVEHAEAQDILDSLMKARPQLDKDAPRREEFTLADLIEAGMAGSDAAALRRDAVGRLLNIGYANAKAFVNKLNVLGITREEWDSAVSQLKGKGVDE